MRWGKGYGIRKMKSLVTLYKCSIAVGGIWVRTKIYSIRHIGRNTIYCFFAFISGETQRNEKIAAEQIGPLALNSVNSATTQRTSKAIYKVFRQKRRISPVFYRQLQEHSIWYYKERFNLSTNLFAIANMGLSLFEKLKSKTGLLNNFAVCLCQKGSNIMKWIVQSFFVFIPLPLKVYHNYFSY